MSESSFVLDTSELGRSPGAMREVERRVSFDHELGSSVIAIPAGSPIELDLRLEAVMEGVLVTGTASATAHGECVRCLRPVSMDVDVDLTELFAYPGAAQRLQDQGEEDEDPLPEMIGDTLDMQGTVIDNLVTALPFQPLCEPGCAGLCDQCGIRLDDAEPGHHHESFDPRWAALAALASSGADEPAGESEPEGTEERGHPDEPDGPEQV